MVLSHWPLSHKLMEIYVSAIKSVPPQWWLFLKRVGCLMALSCNMVSMVILKGLRCHFVSMLIFVFIPDYQRTNERRSQVLCYIQKHSVHGGEKRICLQNPYSSVLSYYVFR